LLAISRRHRVVVRKARDKINSLIVEKTKKKKNNDDNESKIESSKKRKLTSIVFKFVFKFMFKISSKFQRRIIKIETEIDIKTSLSRRFLRKTSTKMIIQSTKKLMNNLKSRNDLEMKNVENFFQNKNKRSTLLNSFRKNDASSKH
jgi:small-conductance mechanosensitive channel